MIEPSDSRQQEERSTLQVLEERDCVTLSSPTLDARALQHFLSQHQSLPLFQHLRDDRTLIFESNPTIDAQRAACNLNKAFNTRLRSLHRGMRLWVQSLSDPLQQAALGRLVEIQFAKVLAAEENNQSEHIADHTVHAKELTTYFTALIQRTHKVDKKAAVTLLDKAESYAKIDQGRPEHCTVTEFADGNLCVQYEEPLCALSEVQAEEYLQIVRALQHAKAAEIPWYVSMDPYERAVLDSFLRSKDWPEADQACIESIVDVFKSIPSKLRTIPGVPNKSRHHCLIFDAQNRLISQSSEVRSSFPASRALRSAREATQQKLTQDNILNVIKEDLHLGCEYLVSQFGFSPSQLPEFLAYLAEHPDIKIPVTVQSLVTPVNAPIFQSQVDSHHPDRAILEQSKRAVEAIYLQIEMGELNIIIGGVDLTQNLLLSNSNYPQNTETIARYEVSQPILDYSIEALSNRYVRDDDRDLIANLYKLLTVCQDKPGVVPNIMVSSLEALLTTKLGGLSWGHCVSGKDRKGLQILHNDALKAYLATYVSDTHPTNSGPAQIEALYSVFNGMEYYRTHGKISSDLKRFSDIYVRLLLNGSAQSMAAENAPGCYGIKTIDRYLSFSPWIKNSLITHYGQVTQEKLYQDHEDLASLNELKHLCGDTAQVLPELQDKRELSPRKKFTLPRISPTNSPRTSPRAGRQRFGWFGKKAEPKITESEQALAVKSILHQIVSHPCWSTKSKNTAIPNNILAIQDMIRDGKDLTTLIQTTKKAVGRGNKNRAHTTKVLYSILCDLDRDPTTSAAQLITLRNQLYGIRPEHNPEETQAVLLLSQLMNLPNLPYSKGLEAVREALLTGFSKDNPDQMDGQFLSWKELTGLLLEHAAHSSSSRSDVIAAVYQAANLNADEALPILRVVADNLSQGTLPACKEDTDDLALSEPESSRYSL